MKCYGEKVCAADAREQKNNQLKQLNRPGRLLRCILAKLFRVSAMKTAMIPSPNASPGGSVKSQISAEALASFHISSTSAFFLAFSGNANCNDAHIMIK